MADEMTGEWVGPMPIPQFLDEFLPLASTAAQPPKVSRSHFKEIPHLASKESDMYAPLANILNRRGNDELIPGLKVVDMSSSPDPDSRADKKLRPDIGVVNKRLDVSKRPAWFGEMKMWIEFKNNQSVEPFTDPAPRAAAASLAKWEFESSAQQAVDCRGQMATYNTEIANRQHRVFIFSAFIGERWARFIRWDRGGSIVSRRFNYRNNPQPLVDFFYRFARLSDEQRGLDTTVRPATAAEKEEAQPHLKQWAPPQTRPFVVFKVPDGGESFREVIGWGPLAEAESPTGRSTRAWPVYDLRTKTVMFLKDTWRAVVPGMCKESEILAELNQAGVRNVPKFVCGDDFVDHITRTDLYTSESWRAGAVSVTPRVHNRFIEDFVGLQLKCFKSSKQLMQVIYDAFIAHQDAYDLCNILHRDVSGNNIMLTAGGGGILNDWDLARKVDDIENGPRDHVRTGTWHFMSTRILFIPGKKHILQDDLESFVHVVLYYGLRYLNHNRVSNLKMVIGAVFEQCEVNADGSYLGGAGKQALFQSRRYIGDNFAFTKNPPMTDWLNLAIWAVGELLSYYDRLKAQPSAELRHKLHIVPPANPLLSEVEIEPPPTPSFDGLDLKTHASMAHWWQTILARPDWPQNEKPHDQLDIESKRTHDDVEDESQMGTRPKKPRGSPAQGQDVPPPPVLARPRKRTKNSQPVVPTKMRLRSTVSGPT